MDKPILTDAERFSQQLAKRKRRATYLLVGCGVAGLVVASVDCVALFSIAKNALSGMSLQTFTNPTGDIDSDSGILNGLVGSAYQTGLGAAMGAALGIGSGVWRTLYADQSIWKRPVEISTESMTSLPSLINGIMAGEFIVAPMHGPSSIAGSVALGLLAAPIISQYVKNAGGLVPRHYLEAAYTMSLSSAQILRHVVRQQIIAAAVAGSLLSTGRILCEAAPLMPTAGFSQFVERSPFTEAASLPTIVANNAGSGRAVERRLAAEAAGMMTLFGISLYFIGQSILTRHNKRSWKLPAALNATLTPLAIRARHARHAIRTRISPGKSLD